MSVNLLVKIFGFVVVAVIVVLAVFLLPAHIQVRSVAPDLPSEVSLRTLLGVPNAPVSVKYITTSTQRLQPNSLSHNSVLIEWASGDLVMLDAGMDEPAALEFGELILAMRDGDMPVVNGTISGLLGEDIKRVKAVGFTHLHIDHTQGLINFCARRGTGATLLQTDYQAKLHNFNTTEGAAIVERSCLEPEIIRSDGLILFDQFPGLGMVPLGGHTPGSTLFVVADDERLLLFPGDTTNNKGDILHDRGKGFMYSYLIVPENTARTSQLRGWLRDLDMNEDMEVVVAHDLQNFEQVLEPF